MSSSAREGRRDEGLPTFSPRLFGLFRRYLRRYLGRHFTGVRAVRSWLPSATDGRPVVVYANHPSWWDPLLFMFLHGHCFPDRALYGPMDAEALKRYGFFRRLGVFGVEPGTTRGAATFLRISRRVLARHDGVLWITAQGRFADPRERPPGIEAGVAHLARDVPGLVLIPLAVEYPFWNERHPEALAQFGAPIFVDRETAHDVKSWTALLAERLEIAQDDLRTLAQARDREPFETVLDGQRGVGGIYDRWRRFRAWTRGERFRAAHGDIKRWSR